MSGARCSRSDAPLETFPPATRHGGCVGPSSTAYALRQAAQLLGDRDLDDAAHAWAATAFAQPIPTDADWIDGLAGAAVALAPFRSLMPDGWLRTVCKRLAASEPLQPGAGHGLAGPLHALHRLGAAVDAPSAHLDRHWRVETMAWGSEAATGWAHGPEGIVLMLHASGVTPDRIAAALDAFARAPDCDLDTLAAGTAARIEMWRSVGETDRARAVAARMCTRAAQEGRYRIPGGGVPLPGLFDGLAGIGYTLLRLDHAEALPSVLLLEDGHAAL